MTLSSFTFFEKLKLAFFWANVAQKNNTTIETLSEYKKIQALYDATETNPNEWIYWYSLVDIQHSLGDYIMALGNCQKCIEIKPNDPRSTYAIASLYRILTRARFVNNPKAKDFQKTTSELLSTRGLKFDPELSAHQLELIGLTIEGAAKESIRYFKQTLQLKINWRETRHITSILKELHEDFPSKEQG